MKFLKDNSYDIVKLFINQIGIAIFSMALYSAVSIAVPGDASWFSALQVGISIFATLFYLVLIYIAMWECGAKDKIRIDSGKMNKTPTKGLYMGLAANAPNFILCGIAALFMGIYLLNDAEWLKNVFAILNLLFGFIESMYLGVIINIFPIAEDSLVHVSDLIYFYRTIGYLIMPIVSVATTTIGYIMGINNYRIASVFSVKNIKK